MKVARLWARDALAILHYNCCTEVQSQGANLGFCEPLTGWPERVQSNASRISLSKYTQSSLENCLQIYKVSTMLNETITSQKETQEMKRSWRFDHLIQLTNPRIVGYTLQVGPRTALFVLELEFKPLGLQEKVISKVFFFSLKSKKFQSSNGFTYV
jgi:hypothetical protein